MKKLSAKTEENEQPAEQPQQGNNEFTATDDQYAAVEEPYAAGDDQYGTEEDQYPGNYQYTPEDTEFSEQYQYTWGWTGRDCRGFSTHLDWHSTTSPFNTLTNHQPLKPQLLSDSLLSKVFCGTVM